MGLFGPNIKEMIRQKNIAALVEQYNLNRDSKIGTEVPFGICKIGDVKAIIQLMDNPGHLPIFIQGLVNLGDPAINPLLDALSDESPMRQGGAITALGLMRDKRAIQPLTEVLEKKVYPSKIPALIALGEIGGNEAFFAICRACSDEDPETSNSAKEVLRKRGYSDIEKTLKMFALVETANRASD